MQTFKMNETQLRKLFPNASADFYSLNPELRATQREQDSGPTLVDQAPGKTQSDVRPILGITIHRVRLLDKDNAYASTKCLVDCIHEIDLVAGDSEKDIELEVTQIKTSHYAEQRTEVKITYP